MLFYIRWSEKASLERRLLSRDTSNVREEGMWTPGRAGIPGQREHACKSPEVALAWQVRGVARGAAGVGYEEQAGQCRGQAREAAL